MLAPFDALIGNWATDATHPLIDVVVPGSITFEWLGGGRFLIQHSHNDHELFPDAISVIGAREARDGLVMEYFDSRGVRRTYGVSLEDGVLRMWRDQPGFDQCYSARLAPDAFEGQWQVAKTPGDWRDDLKVTYRRQAETRARPLHLFAGLRVRDFHAARAWYERLLGEPTFFPHATEAVWTLSENRPVYVVEHADGAGHCVATIFVDDLDAHLAAIAARGLQPDERETYPSAYARWFTAIRTATSWGSAGRRPMPVRRPDGTVRPDAGPTVPCPASRP